VYVLTADAKRLGAALADRYRIERELGAGGMATVYLAADLRHDRKVAIKVLKPELAAVLGAERFVVEIKTTASMSHPHILPLFDSGIASSHPDASEASGGSAFLFYVMPYVQGETLEWRRLRPVAVRRRHAAGGISPDEFPAACSVGR
jgi:serine/threonine-protein kinase